MIDEIIAHNQVLIFVAGLLAAVIWLRAAITKSSINEATNLANTRGEIIADLHAEMDHRDEKWKEKCQELIEQMAELRGQMKSLEQLKTEQIIKGVIDGMNGDNT